MKKACLSLLALGTLIASSGSSLPRPVWAMAESADASKIGAVALENGPFSFETEDGWDFSETGTSEYSTEVSLDGKQSLHVKRSNTDSYFTATTKSAMPLEGGQRYRFGFYYSSKNSYGVHLSMSVTTYDETGNAIRTVQGGVLKLNGDSALSPWSEFFLELQAKSNAVGAKITIEIRYGSADVYLDKAFLRKTGDAVYEESFSTPKEDGTFLNWDLKNAVPSEDYGLKVLPQGSATTFFDTFLSGYGYTFTFDAKSEGAKKGKASFRFVDSGGATVETQEKEFPLSEEPATQSIEVTVKRGVRCYLTFSGDGGFVLDEIHAVKSYSPNIESGWQGKWITYPDSDVTSDAAYQNRWYRKTFELTEKVASASIQLTADDVRFPFLNGHSYGRGGAWATPTILDVTSDLVVGKNVLATRVYNGTYYSGLLFELIILTESGREIHIYSDADTLTSKTVSPANIGTEWIANEDTSWTAVDYDDSSWVKPYVVGEVGCQPWGSIPFISLASTTPKAEVVGVSFPAEVELGETMTFQISWKPEKEIEHNADLSVYFWDMYSSDAAGDEGVQSSLRQIDGPAMNRWVPGEANVVTYEVDVPDYMDPGRYMIQFDEDQIEITGNPDYSNNKLRGKYIKFLATEIAMEKSSVVRENGLTKVRIGGEDYIPFLFQQSDALTYCKPSYVRKMYDAGIRLMSVGNCKVVDNVTGVSSWTGEGKYDFANFDDAIYSMLSGAPKSKILAMISIDPPSWWLNKYPEERAVAANGNSDSVSYASKRWLKDVGAYVRAVLDHMKNAPYAAHIFGIKFAQGATYEWQEYGMELNNCADFSKVARDGFRDFLAERYVSDLALQKAWGDPNVTLKTANVPPYGDRESQTYASLLDGVKQRSVLDYQDFKARNVTNSILHFASLVKEVSEGNWLAGTYQGYITNALTYESSGIGNNEFARLLEKDSNCDFFCGPISYNTRQSGYSDSYMQCVTSVVNAGKLPLAEFDERTVKIDMPDQSPQTMDEWGKTYTLRDTVNLIFRDAGNSLITGASAWLYDMTGGWYEDEEIYYAISLIMKEWEYAFQNQTNENNHEVAFVIEDKIPSDYAYNFGGSYSALEVNLSRQKEDLAVIGAGYDTYLASDFKKGLSQDYKVYIVVGNRFDEETRSAINATCKKPGQAVLWIGTPGIYGDDGSMNAGNVSSFVDMDVSFAPGSVYTAVKLDADNENPLLEGASGITYGKGEILEVSPAAYVQDSDSVSLGKIKGTDYSGLAYKEVAVEGGTYTSMFSSFGHVPAMVIRNLMKQKGCHVYDESYSDVVFSSNGYLCIDSPYGGDRTISLPKAYDVYDVYGGSLIGESISSFQVSFSPKTTYLYRLMTAGSYARQDDPASSEPTSASDSSSKGGSETSTLTTGLWIVGGALLVSAAAILFVALKKKKADK